MKKALLSVVLCSGLLLAAGPKGTTKAAKGGEGKGSWTGTIGDVMCGAKHKMGGMSDKECTLACAKKGKFALVVGSKVYPLEGDTSQLQELAGGRAKVTGTMKDGTITVESAMAAGAAKGGTAHHKGKKKAA